MRKNLLGICFLILLFGCEAKEVPRPESKKTIETCQVSVQTVKTFIETTGSVQLDLEGGAKIVSPLGGTVEKIFVRVGENVQRGTPLAALRSSEVSDTHANLLSTRAQVKQAERSLDLNRKLFEIGAVTKNDLLTSEANYEQTRALAEGMKKKLEIYGSVSGDDLRDHLTLKAPITGRVVDIQAHLGDRFDAANPLMTIANPAKSLIVANVYDIDVSKLSQARKVSFSTDIYPQKVFEGVITYISDMADPDSKTIKVYIRPLSDVNLFKPNLFLRIRILLGEKTLTVVDKSAVFYKSGRFYVYIKNGERFDLKQVFPVQNVSEKVTAVDGLKEGQEIACSALELEKP
ncbi:MAG TPA: efflux RND transporter periplasmic adaptor subunit [Thermodesulfobacteriota bacterium]|nr:efflux RND transporter periplasmic adaptor subunit [Thermodesulfobacteriota bacterium]